MRIHDILKTETPVLLAMSRGQGPTKKCHRAIDIDSAKGNLRNLCAVPCKPFNRGICEPTFL